MDYYIYADGAYSTERGLGSWSFLIFTDIRFIGWEGNKSKLIKSPTYAEDVAVGMACYSLLSKNYISDRDRVIVYSDSSATVNFLSKCLESNDRFIINDIIVDDAIDNILKLKNKTNILINKVHSHKKVLNPNICVDRMAKYYLRKE